MSDSPELKNISDAGDVLGKGLKKKQKEEKRDLSLEKVEIALYRAQLAMVRTATTTTTLGFALYKLLEEKVHDGTKRPILHLFTPRMVALILFFTGLVGLTSFSFRHRATLQKIDRLRPEFYYSGVMLVSYVIWVVTLLLFIGALINP